MAGNELIIDDAYCESAAARCRKKGEAFEALLDSYVNTLSTARSNAICSGVAAQALDRYLDYAVSLRGCVDNISSMLSSTVTSFLNEIDAADKELY